MSRASSSTIPLLCDSISYSIKADECDKANLRNFFSTRQDLVDGSQKNLPANNQRFTGTHLSSISIMQAEVLDVKQTLRRCKAPGPDTINRILHEATSQVASPLSQLFVASPLSQLFNYSLHCCKMPSAWKLSNVCLISKGGDRSILSNYSPVSLLHTMEKVLERIIFKHVFNHMKDTNFLHVINQGFYPVSQPLINVLPYMKKSAGLSIRVRIPKVFFDISEVFKKFWHRGLFVKLEGPGVQGKLLSWFFDYVFNRK